MEILYGFIPYEQIKTGIFKEDTNIFKLPGGWVWEEKTVDIIGETEDSYVYELSESGHGEWIGDKVVQHKYILPMGIHKSRFIRWKDRQLQMDFI